MASAVVVPPPSTPASTSPSASQGAGHLQIRQLGGDSRTPRPGRLHESSPASPAYSDSGRRSTRTTGVGGGVAARAVGGWMRDHGAVGPGRQGTQAGLLPFEPLGHAFLQRTVDSNVGHAVEPPQRPRVRVVVGDEVPAVEEVVPDVADGPLDLALCLGPVRTACPDPEAPVAAEAQELRVLDQPSALLSPVAGDDGLHLVEQQLRRHAAEAGERRFQPPHHDRHRLALVEPEPHPPRVAQHHDQRMPLAPRQPEVREVHLALMARGRLEPPDRLHGLLRPGPGARSASPGRSHPDSPPPAPRRTGARRSASGTPPSGRR